MMDMDAFRELAKEIMAQGYDESTALHYASLIGDVPMADEAGNVVVQDERGREVARLKPLSIFLG